MTLLNSFQYELTFSSFTTYYIITIHRQGKVLSIDTFWNWIHILWESFFTFYKNGKSFHPLRGVDWRGIHFQLFNKWHFYYWSGIVT